MPYISLDNLTQYNERLRDYIDSTFDKLDGANWRKTASAQSVTCYPIPESPLEPEVAFKFAETPPESGTKGPDNPSTITGLEAVSCAVCASEGVDETEYSIDLGGTYYGGKVNLATGVLTVTHGRYVFDGTENITSWTALENVGRAAFPCGGIEALSGGEQACSHLPYTYSWSADNIHAYVNINDGQNGAILFAPYFTEEDMKSWLASEYANGTPVTLVWPLRQSLTVQLTPVLVRALPATSHYTPRQNTIYTSHESVQVGYAKSACKTSEDLVNAIVALGGNI